MIDPNVLKVIDTVVIAAMQSFTGPIVVTASQGADRTYMALLRKAYPAADIIICQGLLEEKDQRAS